MLRSRRLPLALVVASVLGLSAAPAHAGPLVATAGDCSSNALSQPFLPWLDVAHYHLAPGGAFETGASGWTLHGATVVAGNEPWKVNAASDSSSLAISAGGSATSPVTCVGVDHPTLRLFAKRTGGSALGTLDVHVLFEDSAGNVLTARLAAVTGDGAWSPTGVIPIVVNLLPLLPDSKTPVAFRFSASDSSWTIDDVYVDPYCRC